VILRERNHEIDLGARKGDPGKVNEMRELSKIRWVGHRHSVNGHYRDFVHTMKHARRVERNIPSRMSTKVSRLAELI
jgi:hypothetical protein